MTEELRELLWVLEATVAMYPALSELLDRIVAGETFRADELPKRSAAERAAPSVRGEEHEQLAADLA